MQPEAPKEIVVSWDKLKDPNFWILMLLLISNVVAAYRTGAAIDLPPIRVQAEPGYKIQVVEDK
jgi:hypothetical protein